jgi:hypothetical protein
MVTSKSSSTVQLIVRRFGYIGPGSLLTTRQSQIAKYIRDNPVNLQHAPNVKHSSSEKFHDDLFT